MFERPLLTKHLTTKSGSMPVPTHFCIVTQDSDFAERSRLYGAPPKVVWLRCGNSTPQQVEAILRRNAVLITELVQNPELHYVEII